MEPGAAISLGYPNKIPDFSGDLYVLFNPNVPL